MKYENYKLLVVGAALNEFKTKTPYELEIEDLVYKMKDKIVFTGFVKYEEISKLYLLADIATLPSIWDDPAPLTIIESLTCGLPIITTVSGGIPEYAVGGSAIFIKRDSKLIENLAKEIELLLKNEEKRRIMSKKAIEASNGLTIKNYYKEFIHILQDIDK